MCCHTFPNASALKAVEIQRRICEVYGQNIVSVSLQEQAAHIQFAHENVKLFLNGACIKYLQLVHINESLQRLI